MGAEGWTGHGPEGWGRVMDFLLSCYDYVNESPEIANSEPTQVEKVVSFPGVWVWKRG